MCATRPIAVVGVKRQSAHLETSQRNESSTAHGHDDCQALFLDDRVIIAHVGDSRCYRLRRLGIRPDRKITRCSTTNIKMKRLSGEEVGRFQQKNVIVRAPRNERVGCRSIRRSMCRSYTTSICSAPTVSLAWSQIR